MAAGAITYANLFSKSWENIQLIIANNSNVTDPISSSAEYRKWVYSREPDVKSIGFEGFPYVIVNGTIVSMSNEQTVDGEKKMLFWDCEVEIVTSDRAKNDEEGKGLAHLDAISDDIMKTFNSTTIRNTLRDYGMKFSKPVASGVVVEPTSDRLTYRRSFLLSFKNFKKVVA